MHVRRALLVPVALAALLVPVATSAFDASTLVGTWTGVWKNLKFKGVGGPFTIVITSPDADTMVVDASGANFGCGSLATPVSLKKDACPDPNNCPVGEWTVDGAVGAFDTIALAYDGAKRKLVGLGSNCHGGWIFLGRVNKKLTKFKGKSVTATTSGKAKSTIKATRTS
jgi:hypothetical protein